MVQAWYMDNDTADQRLEHHKNPPEYISLDDLYKKTGVEYFKLNMDTYLTDGVLDKIKKERGYSYEDEIICSKECLPDYEKKIKSFYTEHLHADEEIRFVLDGSGYFDVRDGNTDEWIRVAVSAGDMIVLPSGIYHRFTLDTNDRVKVKRFFIGEPVWQAYNRPAEEMPARLEYVDKLKKGFPVAAF
ncbi:hypothetical protein K1T71_001648 [Dendrolimus kikuchii]|uniref:Uncharacterized protein n=1 Tax=Dendrolimus kikuchii TaxID=765133 RepID=A0ACC1DEA4_9NEOP|nr:hypothetical protein K1T71_001648 [Dendrolimus kikuchii]